MADTISTKWEVPMIRMLRYLIGDVSDTETYADERLTEVLIYSSFIIQKDILFGQSYTIDLLQLTINPDPIDLKDIPFINLVTLKAACVISRNELKSKVDGTVKWKQGADALDTTDAFLGQKALTDDICKSYDEARNQFMLGDNCPGKLILGPFSSDRIFYGMYNNFIDGRNYYGSYPHNEMF